MKKKSAQSNGTASRTRQKALAVGPTSDTRTQIGDIAMKTAPVNSAVSGGVERANALAQRVAAGDRLVQRGFR